MSKILFFPVKWWMDYTWKYVYTSGYLDNSMSSLIKITHSPYLTIKYSQLNKISEFHDVMLTQQKITHIKNISTNIYRLYVVDKLHWDHLLEYLNTLFGFTIKILDKESCQLFNFFQDHNIYPQQWQCINHPSNFESPFYIPRQLNLQIDELTSVDLEGIDLIFINMYVDIIQSDSQITNINILCNDKIINLTGNNNQEIIQKFAETCKYYKCDRIITLKHQYIKLIQCNLKENLNNVCWIDLFRFYSKIYSHINIDLDTLISMILIETSQFIPKIIKDLWVISNIETELNNLANFWKNDVENTLGNVDNLFKDIYISQCYENMPELNYPVTPILYPSKHGIFTNVYVYSPSKLYFNMINLPENLKYLSDTYLGSIMYRSGFFPIIKLHILDKFNIDPIWIDETSIGLQKKLDKQLQYLDFIPLVVSSDQDRLLIINENQIYKHGIGFLINPPFNLVNLYIYNLIYDHTHTLDDFTKHLPSDYHLFNFVCHIVISKLTLLSNCESTDSITSQIVSQALICGLTFDTTTSIINYIHTNNGVIIEPIYSGDPLKYYKDLDINWYVSNMYKIFNEKN